MIISYPTIIVIVNKIYSKILEIRIKTCRMEKEKHVLIAFMRWTPFSAEFTKNSCPPSFTQACLPSSYVTAVG